MKHLAYNASWPTSWQLSHSFDRLEIGGEKPRSGYALAYQRRQKAALEAVRTVAQPPASVFDIAGAQGNFTLTLAEAGYRVTWNDIRADLADYVKAKHEQGDVRYLPGNIYDVEPPGLFDVVLLTEVIEHVAHPDRFLERAAAFAKPGGHLVMTTPNGEYWRSDLPRFSDCPDPSQFELQQFKPDSDGHIFLLHEDEVYGLAAQAGLEIISLRFFTNSLTAGHVKMSRALRVLPPRAVAAIERATSRWSSGISRRVNSQMVAVFRRIDSGLSPGLGFRR